MSLVLRSMRVLAGDMIQAADLVIRDGLVRSVEPYGSQEQVCNLGSYLLVPGFVDLHSDAVEKEIEPRPGAAFPVPESLAALDQKLAMSGITTMFHAIGFNDEALVGIRGTSKAAETIREIKKRNQSLAVDNLVHARYEVTSFHSVPVIKELLQEGAIQLLSFMDHSPGQGQFRSLESWKYFHMPTYDINEHEIDGMVAEKISKRQESFTFLEELSATAHRKGVILASHDDDSHEKIDLMRGLGVSISEFPLNEETAGYAQDHNLPAGMGAPNVVRGRSQSGNISARRLVEKGLCSYLCSDYHPNSILQSVYVMHNQMQIPLEQAYGFVTTNPARIGGLPDRGVLSPGKIADILVIDDRDVPQVKMTFKDGVQIYSNLSQISYHENLYV